MSTFQKKELHSKFIIGQINLKLLQANVVENNEPNNTKNLTLIKM